MKYKNMSVGWNNDSVSMTRVCSKCEHEVRDDDLYCSHCGKKFKQLAKFVSKEHILKIIDGKTMDPPKKEILTIVGDINLGSDSISTKERDDVAFMPTCIDGRVNSDGCPHLSADGYCTRTVLTSYPPKYEKCRFCHLDCPQYKFCNDVEIPVSRTATTATNAGTTDIDKKSLDDFLVY